MELVDHGFIIQSEEDAYDLLSKCKENLVDFSQDVEIKFDGWPSLTVRLKGEKYKSTITPSIMAGFIEFQKAIYRSYALSRYNSININKLTKEEREELEIRVKVEEGSSLFGVDFQAALEKFMENVSDKLSKKMCLLLFWF